MDRNQMYTETYGGMLVALRKEGVDRNIYIGKTHALTAPVALRKEGVDRNNEIHVIAEITDLSPSARRAWIEIEMINDQ